MKMLMSLLGISAFRRREPNERDEFVYKKLKMNKDEQKAYEEGEIGLRDVIKGRNTKNRKLIALIRLVSGLIGIFWAGKVFFLGVADAFNAGLGGFDWLSLITGGDSTSDSGNDLARERMSSTDHPFIKSFVIFVVFIFVIPALLLLYAVKNGTGQHKKQLSEGADYGNTTKLNKVTGFIFKGNVPFYKTEYKGFSRFANPKYWKTVLFDRKRELRDALELGSEMAIKMRLWSEKDDFYLNEEDGKYVAYAFDDNGDITFTVAKKPKSLTQEYLLKATNIVRDEYGTKAIKDGREVVGTVVERWGKKVRYNTIKTKIGKNYFYSPTGKREKGMRPKDVVGNTVIFFNTNPLKYGWQVEKANEIKVEKAPLKIYNSIDMNGDLVGLNFKEQAGMVIGGLPGSGKSAGLITSVVPMLLNNTIELHIGDMKGVASEWDNFSRVANLFKMKTDPETHETNFEEIYNRLLKFKTDSEQRLARFKKETGVSNFWNVPLSPKYKVRMMILDECQELFDVTGRSKDEKEWIDKIERVCTEIVKKQRAMGTILVLATQRPDKNSIPTPISSNAGIRLAFRLANKAVETMTLGTPPDDSIVSATDIGGEGMQGTAVMADIEGNRKMIRYAYMDEETVKSELEKAPDFGSDAYDNENDSEEVISRAKKNSEKTIVDMINRNKGKQSNQESEYEHENYEEEYEVDYEEEYDEEEYEDEEEISESKKRMKDFFDKLEK